MNVNQLNVVVPLTNANKMSAECLSAKKVILHNAAFLYVIFSTKMIIRRMMPYTRITMNKMV
jgi:hypothetical protein